MRAALVALLLGACTWTPVPPPEPAPSPSPAPAPAPPSACEAFCDNLKRLDCPAWTPSCFDACENIEDLYRRGESELTLNPECGAKAESCEAVDSECR